MVRWKASHVFQLPQLDLLLVLYDDIDDLWWFDEFYNTSLFWSKGFWCYSQARHKWCYTFMPQLERKSAEPLEGRRGFILKRRHKGRTGNKVNTETCVLPGDSLGTKPDQWSKKTWPLLLTRLLTYLIFTCSLPVKRLVSFQDLIVSTSLLLLIFNLSLFQNMTI